MLLFEGGKNPHSTKYLFTFYCIFLGADVRINGYVWRTMASQLLSLHRKKYIHMFRGATLILEVGGTSSWS
jgi:hypothetical protein